LREGKEDKKTEEAEAGAEEGMTQSPLARAARIILVGPPGVGKGTQTERLMARFPQIRAIGSGDLLRENVRRQTPLGWWASFFLSPFRLPFVVPRFPKRIFFLLRTLERWRT
jgi:adenylate kinase